MATSGNKTTVRWNIVDDARTLSRATKRGDAALPAGAVEAFQTDGVVYLPGLFTPWLASLRAGLERVLDAPAAHAFPCESAGPGRGRFFDAYCNWQRVPEFAEFVLGSPAAAVAARLMQSRTAQLFHEHVFCKEDGTALATPWHQDLPYYCVSGAQTASVYVALDDMPAETAPRFLAGSHAAGASYAPVRFSGAAYDTGGDALAAAPAAGAGDGRLRARRLAAGDAVVFDFRTLHGTTAARVEGRRRAFSTRWLGEDVRYAARRGATSPPLEGLGVGTGERMPERLFPTLWPC